MYSAKRLCSVSLLASTSAEDTHDLDPRRNLYNAQVTQFVVSIFHGLGKMADSRHEASEKSDSCHHIQCHLSQCALGAPAF